MTKIFKTSVHPAPRSILQYERDKLEELPPSELGEGGSRETILAAARREAEQMVREGYAEGLRKGAEAGRAQYQKMVAQSAEALYSTAKAMEEAHKDFLNSLGPQVVEMALKVASRILQREANVDRDLISRTVRSALKHLTDRESMIIRVHPDDLEGMRAEKMRLLEQFDGIKHLSVQPDDSVEPGGCIVESNLVEIDARIDAQLNAILEVLLQEPQYHLQETAENAPPAGLANGD